MRARRKWMLAITLSMLSACSRSPASAPDAAQDGAVDAAVDPDFAPIPPDIPWLDADGGVHLEVAPPVFTPCPAGWRELTDDTGVTTCEPWPEGGHQDCGPGQAHFPGSVGCAPVGAACPVGEWADGLADDGSVLFVRAGATAGDGTRAAPYGRIVDALGRGMGRTIALAKGVYDEQFSLPARVMLRGACAAETRIQYTGGGAQPAIVLVTTTGSTLRDLTLGPASRSALGVVGSGASLDLEGVFVDHATGEALHMDGGASLTGSVLVVQDTATNGRGMFGRALWMGNGSTFQLNVGLFLRNRDAALIVTGAGSVLVLTGVAVMDTEPNASGGQGFALHAVAGGRAELSAVVFERNHTEAVLATDASTVVVSDAVFRDTLPRQSDDKAGHALAAASASPVTLSRVLMEGNRSSALQITESGTELIGTDVVVRDTRPGPSSVFGGQAAVVASGAHFSLDRAVIQANFDTGVLAIDADTQVTLTDTRVLSTQGDSLDSLGVGVRVARGAHLDMASSTVDDNITAGIIAMDEGTALTLTDVAIRRTVASFDGAGSAGLIVALGSQTQATRVLFDQNDVLGLTVWNPGTLFSASDIAIFGTRPNPLTGGFGGAILAQSGATAMVERGLFVGNRQAAVYAHHAGTSLDLIDVAIVATSAADCSAGACVAGSGGVGLGAFDGAHVTARDFLVHGSALCGVDVSSAGGMDLQHGVIAENEIGACVQVDGYDIARLTNDVAYLHNASRDVEATAFPDPPSSPELMISTP